MFKPKLFSIIKHRQKELPKQQLLKDIIAGLLVGFIALPLSIALAIASGVSPEKGLATAIIAGMLISLFGGSRVQIGGPTGAFVIIVYSIVQKYGLEGLTTATIIGGLILIIFGVLKFGTAIKYIPYPITTGFTSGIAVVLFTSQVKDFLGLNNLEIPVEFLAKWFFYLKNLTAVNNQSVLLGSLALLIMIFWPKFNKIIPGSLLALIGCTLLAKIFNLNVPTIGSSFGEMKNIFFLPKISLNLNLIIKLIPSGMVIALLGGVESLLSAVVADGMIGKKHKSNIELIAQGLGNIGSALFGGIPATGAIARTSANIFYGGRTPVSGITHSLTLLVISLFFFPLVKFIPMTVLAAILFIVAKNMGEWKNFRELFKAPLSDIFILLTTFLLTVFVDLVYAIGIGMFLAALAFMKRMADITEVNIINDEVFNDHDKNNIDKKKFSEQILVYEINGPFFFGAANTFVDEIEKIDNFSDFKVLVLRLRNVPVMDATAYYALLKIFKKCSAHKIQLILSQVQEQPLKLLQKQDFVNLLGKEYICENIDKALKKAESILV
ncbi:MAG: STAS domain-containing protein [Candidatus Margulisbacteria bacterium]|nr:STAS domain-containing protein [Candidatus Margulisiibacteriota bacterium]